MGATGRLSDLKPWTALPNRKYAGMHLTERAASILDCVAMETLGGARSAKAATQRTDAEQFITHALSDVLVDLSQNPARRAFSSNGVAKCLHTGTLLYSFHHDRIVLPIELMLLQGHSSSMQVPSGMSQRELHDLAGMGIAVPCLALILVALMATGALRCGLSEPKTCR